MPAISSLGDSARSANLACVWGVAIFAREPSLCFDFLSVSGSNVHKCLGRPTKLACETSMVCSDSPILCS